jgi:SepF-like predicted cell division protein (DUF552 family)
VPQVRTLRAGSAEKFDLDADAVYDLSVSLMTLLPGLALLDIRLISEPVPPQQAVGLPESVVPSVSSASQPKAEPVAVSDEVLREESPTEVAEGSDGGDGESGLVRVVLLVFSAVALAFIGWAYRDRLLRARSGAGRHVSGEPAKVVAVERKLSARHFALGSRADVMDVLRWVREGVAAVVDVARLGSDAASRGVLRDLVSDARAIGASVAKFDDRYVVVVPKGHVVKREVVSGWLKR